VFTRALHWSLSWARSIQSITSHPVSLRSNLLLLHVHPLLGKVLVNKFPRRQSLGKQSVARLRNNICGCVIYVVRATPSTVTLRLVGGDEKGSLKSETVKYGREFQGTRTRERLRWRGPVAYTKGRPVLSSEDKPRSLVAFFRYFHLIR
jgi:hypothetical protein